MPKPTFMQSVLRKPTRSYAISGYSPWADYDEEPQEPYRPPSRYAAAYDQGVYQGYRYAPAAPAQPQAGPSRPSSSMSKTRKSGPRSTVSETDHSEVRDERTAGTRFPKAARRVQSHVTLTREGEVVHTPTGVDGQPVRSTTVKKKKKKPRSALDGSEDGGSILEERYRAGSPAPMSAVQSRRRRTHFDSMDSSVDSSLLSVDRMPPLDPPRTADRGGSSSSTSSPVPPLSPKRDTPTPDRSSPARVKNSSKHFADARPSMPTPSSSQSSTHVPQSQPKSRSDPMPPPPVESQRRFRTRLQPAVVVPLIGDVETDEENEAFYTPRGSMDQPRSVLPTPIRVSSLPVLQESSPITPSIAPPSLALQPPTPAALSESDTTPFQLQSSHLGDNLRPQFASVPFPRPATIPVEMPASPPPDDDVESAHGQVGSDEDEESERLGGPNLSRPTSRTGSHSRQASFSRYSNAGASHSKPPSTARSGSVGRPASSIDGRPAPSVQSRRSSKTYDDFVIHRRESMPAAADRSYAGSIYEGSVRSANSGFGKGGWAAAHAHAKPGPNSPVIMYMPESGTNDGWADFQIPPPPPKPSRFTPLPAGSVPLSFDKLTNGSRLKGSSAGGSQTDNRLRKINQAETASSPSQYSQASAHEPSRSYASHGPSPLANIQDQSPDLSGLQRGSEFASMPPAGEQENSDSDEEEYDLPKPSRSYLHTGHDSPGSAGYDGSNTPDDEVQTEYTPEDSPPDQEAFQRSNLPPPRPIALPEARYPPPPSSRPSSAMSRVRPKSAMDGLIGSPSMNPHQIARPMSVMSISSRPQSPRSFHPPSFLNPDTITFLPEMSAEDSNRTYIPDEHPPRPPKSVKRAQSVFGGLSGGTRSSNGDSEALDQVGELPPRRSKSALGFRMSGSNWEGSSSYGEGGGVLMESHGRDAEAKGYSTLILPAGAYRPAADPLKLVSTVNTLALRMPHATMAAITLASLVNTDTPAHLRHQFAPPVDFSSHLPPPPKVGAKEVLIHVHAVALDDADVRALDHKNRGDIGRWVPGRSFVGRCMMVGTEEKEIVRGDLVMGLMDLRKSGALAEYALIDRRHVSRIPYPTSLSLEQLALLPLQGVPTARIVRTRLVRHSRAIIANAHNGIGALVCQEMSRAGVNVTAVIVGGDGHHEAQVACMTHGARGVLTGSLAGVLNTFEDSSWDFVMDSGSRGQVVDIARRVLRDGGTFVSVGSVDPSSPNGPAPPPFPTRRSSGFKSLRAAFSKRKDSKHVTVLHYPPAGTGEPEVDASGMDLRDVLEEPCMSTLRPVAGRVWPFEQARDAFRSMGEGTVVRIIN